MGWLRDARNTKTATATRYVVHGEAMVKIDQIDVTDVNNVVIEKT